MSELKVNAPSIYENLMKITDFSDCETIYSEFEKISIDFALMEKLENDKVVVIPADLGWSDIGTWETLHGELEQDEFGNVLQGEFVVDNVKNCLLINKTTTPAVLYKMENTVCVFSDYGNLVGDIYDSGTLKKLVNLLNDGR
jgi:mannose-1-phosphate guanylyltransferase